MHFWTTLVNDFKCILAIITTLVSLIYILIDNRQKQVYKWILENDAKDAWRQTLFVNIIVCLVRMFFIIRRFRYFIFDNISIELSFDISRYGLTMLIIYWFYLIRWFLLFISRKFRSASRISIQRVFSKGAWSAKFELCQTVINIKLWLIYHKGLKEKRDYKNLQQSILLSRIMTLTWCPKDHKYKIVVSLS